MLEIGLDSAEIVCFLEVLDTRVRDLANGNFHWKCFIRFVSDLVALCILYLPLSRKLSCILSLLMRELPCVCPRPSPNRLSILHVSLVAA